ncbi:hypothetical protein BJV78DRAFT_1284786 [Lactifluus subvellereus]|nr:hypothetical protein BJV78DRAFT_1284786 [Lactifluus subvellereus]
MPSGEQRDHTFSFRIPVSNPPASAGSVSAPTYYGGIQPMINPQEAFRVDSLSGGSPLTLPIGTFPPLPAGDNKGPDAVA